MSDKISSKRFLISIGLALFSVVVLIACKQSAEKSLAIIPCLIFSFWYVGIVRIDKYRNHIVGLSLFILTSIRYYVLPLAIILDSNYLNYRNLGYGGINADYFQSGVILTVWEAIFVGIAWAYLLPQWYESEHAFLKKEHDLNDYSFKCGTIVFFVIAFAGLSLLNPNVMSGWNYVFNLDESTSVIRSTSDSALLPTIASMAFWNLHMLLPIPIFCWIVKNKRLSEFAKYVLSIMVFMLTYGLLIEGTSRASVIFPVLASYLIIAYVFPNRKKTTLVLFVSFIIIIFITITIWKSFTRSGRAMSGSAITDLISSVDIYFQGFSNMGKAVAAKERSGIVVSFTTLFTDLLSNIPIASKLTSFENSSLYWFHMVWGRNDQVIPATGNGLFYFGYVFAPIIPVVQSCIAHFFEKKVLETKLLAEIALYSYASILVAYGCFSNISICMQKLFNTLIGVIIVVYLNRHLVLSHNKVKVDEQ